MVVVVVVVAVAVAVVVVVVVVLVVRRSSSSSRSRSGSRSRSRSSSSRRRRGGGSSSSRQCGQGRVHKATLVNSTLSFFVIVLLSFYYRKCNTRCSLACLPRYHAANRQDVALSFFIPPYRFTSPTCYRPHCVYSCHKSYAQGYYTTPSSYFCYY